MLFDLLSTDIYVSYNSYLAQIVGLHASIYISELININRKAIKKEKLIEDYFRVDRQYIEERTTLKRQEQWDLDKSLSDIDIISIGEDKDLLKVNMDSLTGVMLEKDKKIISEASNIVKRGRPSKKETIIRNLKSYIKVSNSELYEAYSSWIDSVMEKQGWMSKDAVIEGQKIIDAFCNRDLDLALDLLKIASIGGYRDINWAINDYNKNHRLYKTQPILENPTPIKLSEEVF